jgi:uncharacterized protein (DUF885 family)
MAETSLDDLTHGFIADYLEFYPTLGAGLGLHLYDGRTGDYTQAAIDAWLRTLGAWERRLAGIEAAELSAQGALDVALIRQTTAAERFRWEVLRDHERNPITASWPLDVTGYLKRNYAPLDERARALASHLEDVPLFLEAARGHLRDPLPLPIVETAREVFGGYVAFYTADLPSALDGLEDRALRARCVEAAAAATAAVRQHLAFLEEAADRGTQAFAIGESNFAEMLRSGEMVDIPLDRLLALGEAELARLTDDLRATAGRIDGGAEPRAVMARLGQHHPTAEALIPETAAMLEDLRAFLIDRAIVTVPPDVRPRVEETPPFARWAFAMMDTAGAFEQVATESYYYVTPPEPDWPPERRDEWLTKFDYATLKATSIHEAYPGHFVHFMHVRRAPSIAAKVLTSYSFVEGWAHYCEEMMLEAGVDPDPQFRLAFLGEALVRVVRYLAAIRMHARGLPLDAAVQMFEEHAYMEPLTARKEAVRGTFDPGYLNYTLGKFLMRRLRDDYRAERGAAFTLRDFHDRLIGLGAPPVPLARRALLSRDSDIIL